MVLSHISNRGENIDNYLNKVIDSIIVKAYMKLSNDFDLCSINTNINQSVNHRDFACFFIYIK